MKKSFRIISLCLFTTLFIVLFVVATNDIQCIFYQNITCPSGTQRLLGVSNDTNGSENAHAQNTTFAYYNYSICCNNTNSSISITTTCPGNVTVVRLSNSTNAHVEIGTNSNANYSNASACFSSNWKRAACTYPTGSCPAGYNCTFSIASSEGDNTTNAHIGDCSYYNQKICCGLTNSAPLKPTLYYPNTSNTSVFERRPNFNWSSSSDPDGGFASYYTLNISCGGAGCSCYQLVINVSSTNYTVTSPLCVNSSTYPVSYNWTVSACDSYDACNLSDMFNFTILSQANLILLINSSNFGSMAPGQNNNTLLRSPTQLVAQNIGNVLLNVTINSTTLFSSVSMNTTYYQYEASINYTNSFISGCSRTYFTNMTLLGNSGITMFCNLSYENNTFLGNSTGNMEFNITVPLSEPAGSKNSTLSVNYNSVEG
jgi:hypothetical protein